MVDVYWITDKIDKDKRILGKEVGGGFVGLVFFFNRSVCIQTSTLITI